jgi:hypothetical protein
VILLDQVNFGHYRAGEMFRRVKPAEHDDVVLGVL